MHVRVIMAEDAAKSYDDCTVLNNCCTCCMVICSCLTSCVLDIVCFSSLANLQQIFIQDAVSLMNTSFLHMHFR